MSEPRTAILVLHYGRPELTERCVRSVLESETESARRIVVILDNSEEQRFEYAGNPAADGIVVMRTGANLGYAGGMNVGIGRALQEGADLVFLLNNDTEIEPGALDRLSAFLRATPGAGIVSPLIVHGDRQDLVWATGSRLYPALGLAVDPRHNRPRDNDLAKPFAVDSVTGCAMLVRAEVFRNVGDLDVNYFTYYEDVDFCYRARRFGYNVHCVPRACVRHKVAAASQDSTRRVEPPDYFMVRNRIYFMRKTVGRPQFAAFCLYLTAATVLAALHACVCGRVGKATALIRGLRHVRAGRTRLADQPVGPRISACIIARNSGKTIRRCLESLSDRVDEIVIVDSGSTDDTLSVCREYTDRIFTTTFRDDFSALRNLAAQHAAGPWILALDADEYLSDDLRKDLRTLASDPSYWAFYFRRTNFCGEKRVRFGYGAIDSLLRLYRKQGSFYAGKVHEKVVTQGPAKRTRLRIVHRQPYDNYNGESFRRKWLPYAAIESREVALARGNKALACLALAPVGFVFVLLRDLVLLGGILEGWRGLKMAYRRALYRYVLYVRLFARSQQ